MHNFDLSLLHVGNEIDIVFFRGRKIRFELNVADWELEGSKDIPFQLVEDGADFVLGDPRSQMMYRFNSDGELIRIEDRNGNSHVLSYTNNNLTQVTDGVGRTLTFNYDSAQHVE